MQNIMVRFEHSISKYNAVLERFARMRWTRRDRSDAMKLKLKSKSMRCSVRSNGMKRNGMESSMTDARTDERTKEMQRATRSEYS